MTLSIFKIILALFVTVDSCAKIKHKVEPRDKNIKMSRRAQNRSQATSLNVSSQSQLSQSSRRGNRSISPSSPDDENYGQYTAATVKYILNHMATNYPIKRSDLVKECCNGNTKTFTIILTAVQNHLKSVSVALRTKYLFNKLNCIGCRFME